ncbi:MAG: alpha/beta hydrolase [Roseivirga sp.]|nr:alpha/beta hydrolase [Roseivirga sp.]
MPDLKRNITVAVLLLLSLSLQGQELEKFDLKTDDGKKIVAVFQMNKDNEKKRPTIILVHGGGRSKEIWQQRGTFRKLYAEGYNVLAFDLRGNGESDPQTPGNFVYPFADFQVALDWLNANKEVETGKIGAMGSSYGSNVLAAGMQLYDWNVDTVITLSATAVAFKVLGGRNVVRPLKNAYYIACEDELERYDAANVAQKLYDITKEDRNIEVLPGRYHGSSIYPMKEKEILAWFDKHLK